MRIGVHITHLTDFRAGIATVAAELIERFAEHGRGHEYILYSARPVTLDFTLPPHFTLRLGRCPAPLKHFWIAGQGRRLARDRVDAFLGMNFMLPFRCPTRVRTAVFVYDLTHRFHPETMTRRNRVGTRLLLRAALKRAHHVVACTQTGADEIETLEKIPRERIRVVPLAASAAFRLLPRQETLDRLDRELGLRPPYLLCTATLEPRKNLVRLLEAFAILKKAHPQITLVLTGQPGWKSRDLGSRIEGLGLGKAVRLTGFVSQDVLVRLLNGAEAFVYPSLYEGFGLPLLEAMRCGVPVVTSEVSCLPEVAGGAALLANPLNPGDIATELGRILDDADLARSLRAKGLEWSAEFTWERTAGALLDLLET